MIIIALSANLPSRYGDPVESFSHVINVLAENGMALVRPSSIWHTAPIPYTEDQPWYHNAVLQVETELKPAEILKILKDIEKDFGRVSTVRNASRPLDLDLICYYDELINEENLTVPHPRMQERAFVLCPMNEIDPNWSHPRLGINVEEMLRQIDIEAQGIKLLGPIPTGHEEASSAG